MLGAAALGDIGKLFPDDDEKWKNADSLDLLKRTCIKIRSHGFSFCNADITIVLESPRLSPYIDRMRMVLAGVLETDICNINVKATTEEKLGFTGDGSGISSTAVVLLEVTSHTRHEAR